MMTTEYVKTWYFFFGSCYEDDARHKMRITPPTDRVDALNNTATKVQHIVIARYGAGHAKLIKQI